MKNNILLFVISAFLLSNILIFAKEFKGAEYRTKDSFIYGRFEVSMKSSYREGMLSSFFTYYDSGGVGIWNEIDIEILGRYQNDFQMNTITQGQTNHVGRYQMSSSPHAAFHTYAFEWTPEYVSWFVDGIEVLKQTGVHIQNLTHGQKIMMNVWNPQYQNWVGIFYPEALPSFSYYDWVSYYAYTPGSGTYGTGNNFTHSWTDEFNDWDTTRWDKATHTFGGNGCDFIQANAVFDNGKLILCLTNSTNIGYVDLKAPTLLTARATEGIVEAMFSEEVEETSAETKSNYTIPGVTINNVELQADFKTVLISVTGLDLNTAKNLIVLGVRDRAPTPNIMIGAVKTIHMVPNPLTLPLKINCGGSAVLDYSADQGWSYQTEFGVLDGSNNSYAGQPIGGTEEDEVFQSGKNGMVYYNTRVPNGKYKVKLMFAENHFTSSGKRIFDVYIEQNRVIQDLDIFSQVGINNAYQVEFENINIQDGILNLYFAPTVDYAIINGIVITPDPNSVDDENDKEDFGFRIEQNFPNPFNGKTIINYSLSSPDNLSFELFNILGERVFIKDLGYTNQGFHQFELDTGTLSQSPLTSGIYLYVFTGADQRESRKLVLLN